MAKRKPLKIFVIIISIILGVIYLLPFTLNAIYITVSSLGDLINIFKVDKPQNLYRTYESAYTEDEHIERIDSILENNFKYCKDIDTPYDRVSYKWVTNIEILYSIGYEFPEYFIVEFKVPEGTLNVAGEPYSYSDCYIIGTIKNDEYYQLDFAWKLLAYAPFIKGESPYKNMQEKSQKKYYAYDYSFPGENCAYKENDKYVFINNEELNTNYPTEESINVLGNVVYTTVWKRGGTNASLLLEPEVTVESLGERQFYSNFTAQENLQRLETLVKTNSELIAVDEYYEAENIIDVQIMYSLYYEYPEYFLIQFKKERIDEPNVYDYQFIVGQIKNDNFYKIYVSPLDNNLGISPYFNNEKTHGTKKYFMPMDENKKIGTFLFLTKETDFIWIAVWNKFYAAPYEIVNYIDYIKQLDSQTLMPLMITQN